jgi:DNA polymerase III epsilon subunit-like protein
VPATEFPHSPLGPVATVVILDTETTGLDASRDQVIELALLRIQVDTQTGLATGPVQVYDGLRDPGMPVPKIAREITGITDEMLAGQQLDMARVDSLLAGADLVIAHNAGFDRPFVEGLLPQAQGLNWACSFADIDWTAAGHSSAKLSYLASALGWFYDAHRAEMDCHALLTVLMAELPGLGVQWPGAPAGRGPPAELPASGHRRAFRGQGFPQEPRLPLGQRRQGLAHAAGRRRGAAGRVRMAAKRGLRRPRRAAGVGALRRGQPLFGPCRRPWLGAARARANPVPRPAREHSAAAGS